MERLVRKEAFMESLNLKKPDKNARALRPGFSRCIRIHVVRMQGIGFYTARMAFLGLKALQTAGSVSR